MRCAKKKKQSKKDAKQSGIIKKKDSQKGWLQYEIRVSKNKILQLTLTMDGYREEFIQFVKQNKLSKPQALRIKQLIKSRLDEELSKVEDQKQGQLYQYQQQQSNNQSKYGVNVTWGQCQKEELQEEDGDKNVEDQQVREGKSESEEIERNVKDEMKDDARGDGKFLQSGDVKDHRQELKTNSPQMKESCSVVNKKLFQSQIYSLQQHPQQQPHILWHHQFSSIHQLQNLSSSNHDENQQQQYMLPHPIIQSQHQLKCDSKNHINQPESNLFTETEENQSQLMMKEYQKGNISWREKMKFFRLDDCQDDGMSLVRMLRNKTKPVVKKKGSVKKEIKPLTHHSPIKPKTPPRNRSPIIKQKSPPINNKTLQQQHQQQKLLNQKIFHRLHKQQTQAFKQKHSFYQPIYQKQLKDQQIVSKYNYEHTCQFDHLTHKEKMQIFYNLHNTSTASSMNKQYDQLGDNNNKLNQNNYGANQIQNVINLTAKNKPLKRLPNMNSKVYQATMEKKCNEHCQHFSQEKRISQQKKLSKQKQKIIRDQLRSRSKDSLQLDKSAKHKVKRSGECSCCHHAKLDKQRWQKQKHERKRQRSYTSKTKYSIEKLFPPYNHVSFISDVLQQSYNELFPEK